ncbi:MAG: hypothetical protein E6G76_20440 [Alphaproteobacteria bacterium]|nr:MAG: hypothetical protein E6G76_20440 [Alphaproteobacteria bacterium]
MHSSEQTMRRDSTLFAIDKVGGRAGTSANPPGRRRRRANPCVRDMRCCCSPAWLPVCARPPQRTGRHGRSPWSSRSRLAEAPMCSGASSGGASRRFSATMQMASAGAGSTGHLDCMLLNATIGINVTHVPYRGGGPAMQDLIAGRIDYICTLSATARQQIEGKLIKAIAILSRDRSTMLPGLASAREQGLDFEASTWFGFFLPKGTPAPIIQKLNEATVAAIDTPSVQEQLKEVGAVAVAPERRSPVYLQKFVLSEIDKNAAPIKAAGLAID